MNLSLQLDESDKSPSVTPPRRRPAAASPDRRPAPKVIDLTDSPERVPPASASPLPLAARLAQRQRRLDESTEELYLERSRTSPKTTYEAAVSPQPSPIASPERFAVDNFADVDDFGDYDDPHELERTTYSDPETPSKRPKHAVSAAMDDLLAPVISSSQPVGRSAPPEPAVRKTAKQVADESKKRKADEKQQKAEAKEREKQQKRDERAKARKRTKEEAAAEMSVTIDRRVIDQRGAHILAELQKICTATTTELSVPGLIQWRRKGSVALERALVLRMKAPDFAAQEEAAAFRPLVTQLQLQNPSLKLIFLLESWNDLLRARQRDANAAYRAAILHNKEGDGAGVADHRAVAQLKVLLDDTILWLEVERHCQVWQTETPEQSALWLCTLTTQLGLLPYKPKPSFDTFCAEAAPKKAYATPVELWSQQLQCINGVSSDIAQAITLKYPTMASLLRVYASALNDREKRELLRNVPLLGADGQAGTRRVGQAVSEKVYKLFTSTKADEVL